ncbi:MAG: hypothetical protein ACI4R6_08000, partial [Lachnospiraceae bacterium]
ALIVMLVYYAGGAAFRFGVSIFNESSMDDPAMARTKTVTIPDDPSIKEVAKVLDDAELVDGTLLFTIQAMLSNYSKYFVGGTFELNTGMTPTEIMAAITEESRGAAAQKEQK